APGLCPVTTPWAFADQRNTGAASASMSLRPAAEDEPARVTGWLSAAGSCRATVRRPASRSSFCSVRCLATTRLSTTTPTTYTAAMAVVATAATLAAGLALTPCWPSLGGDPVADAADGLDPRSGARELGAQPGQVHVDGVRAERVGLVVPNMLGDRATVGDTRG